MLTIYLCALIISLIIMLFMIDRLSEKYNSNDIYKYFFCFDITLVVHIFGLILQILFYNSDIPPIYFDYITYIGASFSPIFLLFISLAYNNNAKRIKKLKILYVLPFIFLAFLFTNDLHHLFYIKYSIYLSETVYGPVLILYALYSYSLFIISMLLMIITSIKRSGFFSKQTLLIVVGMTMPTLSNCIGLFKILPITIYVMPIMFIVTSVCCSISIFKYKALNITPVAFKTVINTMSDAFIVISDDGTIVDMNKTFEEKFANIFAMSKDDNLFKIIQKSEKINLHKLKENIERTRKTGEIVTDEYHFTSKVNDKYFEVDIHPIAAKSNSKEYVGTLLLFKDITQHKEDIKQIEEKQDIIVKQGQLVSIGELAGGVAHDINTPISAIKTGILMLNQMNNNRSDDEKEILQRMDNCATKIINIVNSMRNQIRNLGGDTNVTFKISEVVNDVKVITYHEVTKNNSEVIVNLNDDLEIKGDPTKLGQVLTNLVVNAAQAYGEDKGGKVEITVEKAPKKMAMIKVADYAGGLDPSITPYIFKNILTTKGTFGTGLGLYLAYSVIKGNFNGDITFETEQGEGTTFYITIPIS